MKKLLKIGSMVGAIGLLSTALTFSPGDGMLRVSDAVCEEGTCCIEPSSGCPGVGEGWYQTGLCGPCYNLEECPDKVLP